MDEQRRTLIGFLGIAAALAPLGARAQTRPFTPAPAPTGAIALDAPRNTGGMPIMEALWKRQSTRAYSPDRLAHRQLSELLWAGIGINRPDGHRTAPNWRDAHSIDLYAVLPEGVYLYNPQAHRLEPFRGGDFRGRTGTQDFVAGAPLNLLMVADLSRMGPAAEADKKINASADAACVAQNVYLYCASEGLGTVLRGNVDRVGLHKALGLAPEQYIAYAQTVGRPG